MKPIIRIVLDNGTVFKYEVETLRDVREHIHKIMIWGFRSDDGENFRCYPTNRISHIDAILLKGLKDELLEKYPAKAS